MQLHFFSIETGDLFFHGISPQPDYLWNIQARLNLAKANVLQIQQLHLQTTAILIGAEHLAFLNPEILAGRQVIVIEKSELLYHFYQEQKLIPSELPVGVQLILGELGFISNNVIGFIQVSQLINEFGKITLQLYALSGVDWNQIQLFYLPNSALDINYLACFNHCIGLIINAKLFHTMQQNVYQQINQTPKKNTYLYIELNHQDLEYSKTFQTMPDYLFKGMDKIVYVFGGSNNKTPQQSLFPHGLIQNNFMGEQALLVLKSFIDKALDLLKVIQQYLPKYIVWRNRIIFDHVEDMLFTEQMFHFLNIPCVQFFIDLYNQLSKDWSGAWSYALSRDYFKSNYTYTLGPISILDQWYGPKDPPVRTYRLRYPHGYDEMVAPVASPEQIKNDIAVVHSGPFMQNVSKVTYEFAEIIATYSHLEFGKLVSVYFRRLREYFLQDYSQCYSYSHQLIINKMEWELYLICRQKRALACLPVFSQYRTQFYGQHWETLVPAEFCGGFLKTNQEVRDVYHHSLVSVVLSQSVSTEIPNHGIINMLNAGGLPIVYRPSFGVGPAPAYPFFQDDSLIYVNNPEEIKTVVQSLQQDWNLRQSLIGNMQQKLLMPLRDDASYPTIATLLAKKSHEYHAQVDLKFCEEPEMENLLLETGVAFIFYLLGFNKVAFAILNNVHKTGKIDVAKLDLLRAGF